jgi:nitroreductase
VPVKYVISGPSVAPGAPDGVRARSKALLWRALAALPNDTGQRAYGTLRASYRTLTRGATTTFNSQLDLARYLRHSFVLVDPTSPAQMRSFLRMRYHTFEKGLSLPEPRPGFGQVELEALLRVLARYEREAGYDDLVATVVNVLTAYQSYNALHGVTLAHLDEALEGYRNKYPQIGDVSEGGTIPLTKAEIERVTDFDFEAFAFARHSVRNYTSEPVALELIERAVRVAQRAPSVCNRQAGRAHVYTDKARVEEILSYQIGHRGFGHTVPCVMILTADLQSYYKPGERFQGWVDGGLFTMSLIFGLHAQGLGSCCLNWNVTRTDDVPMRAAAGIPDNEVVITMLAVGHLPDEIQVASSPRRPLDEVLIYG